MATPTSEVTIRTPDQRVRVFVSSTLLELADERLAAKRAIERLRLTPVMFELGARPHPPRSLYKAYLEQSHVFVGIYWERYGWIADGMEVSGLEDEWQLAGEMPRLVYVKRPSDGREEKLKELLLRIQNSGVSYKSFSSPQELESLLADDLAVALSERFEASLQSVPLQSEASCRLLPSPATPLFGRDADIAKCTALLLEPDVRMLTLVGPGGIGKTRLAIEVAKQLSDHFADGVCFLELASLQDPALLPTEILNQVGGPGIPSRSPMDTIILTLRKQSLLLVLDNFEHLLGGANYISEMIEGCPFLHILVTSRAALQIKPEHEYAVCQLESPVEHDLNRTVQELSMYSAIRLFVDRTRAIRPDFELDSSNAEFVRNICSRLEGIPLAIELAAARTKTLDLPTMIELLNSGLEVLSSGRRDAPDRQKTLRATIKWSYDLLTEKEKQVLNRICVFHGGTTLECAYLVAGMNEPLSLAELKRRTMYVTDHALVDPSHVVPTLDFLDAIESLVAKSLLRVDISSSREPRYVPYEAVREFCIEELKSAGQLEDVRLRHAIAITSCVEKQWPRLWGPDATKTYSYFDLEIDNVRAALAASWVGYPEIAMRLAIAAAEYWDVRQLREATDWLTKCIEAAERAGVANTRLFQLTKLELTRRYFRLERWQEMFVAIDEIEKWAQEHGDSFLSLDAVHQRTMALAYAGALDKVHDQVSDALPISRRIGYRFAEMCLIQNLGAAEAFAGDAVAAQKLLIESMEMAKELGAHRRAGICSTVLAIVSVHLSDPQGSLRYVEQTLDQIRTVGDHVLLLYNLTCLSVVAILYQDYEKALHIASLSRRYSEFFGVGFVPVAERDVSAAEREAIAKVGSERAREILESVEVTSLHGAVEVASALCREFSLRPPPGKRESGNEDTGTE